MARRRVNTTKLEIIQTATRMFLKNGYSATSIKAIANALDMQRRICWRSWWICSATSSGR